MPVVIGGRYGLSSKEFTPGMVAGVFEELAREQPRRRFTIGINDDVSHTSLAVRRIARHRARGDRSRRVLRAGFGRHGRREQEHDQDPRRRGEPARPGLLRLRLQEVRLADRLAPALRTTIDPRPVPRVRGELRRLPQVRDDRARRGARSRRPRRDAVAQLSPTSRIRSGTRCRTPCRRRSSPSEIELYAIDAGKIAREAGLAGRTNTVLQTCFFAISGVLERDQAIEAIKASIEKTYGKRGEEVVKRNIEAVDRSLAALHRVPVPDRVSSTLEAPALVPADAPEFVRTVTAAMMAGHGDRAARERAAGRRHVSERHDQVREAQHLGPRRGLGLGALHPVRQLQLRLPAQRDQIPLLRAGPPGRRSRQLPLGAAERSRAPRRPVHAAGVRRGLHRMRAVRRGLSGVGGQ